MKYDDKKNCKIINYNFRFVASKKDFFVHL